MIADKYVALISKRGGGGGGEEGEGGRRRRVIPTYKWRTHIKPILGLFLKELNLENSLLMVIEDSRS
jgi:hypothetical protein